MPTIRLADRALLTIEGPDAEHFLQNILTLDLDQLGAGVAMPGALLTPQGKVLFDFLISRTPGGFRIDCRAEIADEFLRRLMLYRLRAKVQIRKTDQPVVAAAWEVDSSSSHSDSGSSGGEPPAFLDGRFPEGSGVMRIYGSVRSEGEPDAYARLRICHGIAESGSDYALGDAFPHDVLLDQVGGIGFRKGCYVGQEVVSRMQHRGTARRRVLIVTAERELPATGTEITAAGRLVGTLGSVSGGEGLAVARIDRVKEAMDAGTPLLAGDVPVQLVIPAWAKFGFPVSVEGEGA